MLDQPEIDNLLRELNSVKSEVRELRNKINTVDRQKEDLFREKRKISSDIFARIKNVKDSKEKRNNLTDVVKNTKGSKEEIEARVVELEKQIDSLKQEKRKLLEKLNIEDPSQLKRNIKAIEFKIETSGLTFEKEKEMMKVLGKMKKQYANVKVIDDIERKLDVAFRELRPLRDNLGMTKQLVHTTAKESQKHHVELVENSKEIDTLRNKEVELEDQIIKFKSEIHTLSEEINAKLTKLDDIKKVLLENNVKLKEDQEKSNNDILRQKDNEVQEKIKTGKKLTTEDLLILQRTMK